MNQATQARPELIAEAKRGLTYLRRVESLVQGATRSLEKVLADERQARASSQPDAARERGNG
jgi:hypothetical protein